MGEKETEEEEWGRDGAKNKMAASQAPKNYNAIWSPFCFLTVMLALCSLSLSLFPIPSLCAALVCVYFVFVVFFVYFEASSFHFSLGRVGALATSSPNPAH